MASTKGDAERLQPGGRSWRKSTQRLSRRLFCCSCLGGERKDPLQGQEKKTDGDLQPASLDQRGSGEKEATEITVEDLGMVNPSFSMSEEDFPATRSSMARSASSVCACHKALKKKSLKPLSSLPIQPRAEGTITSNNGEDDEEEDEAILFKSGTDSTLASGSTLMPPVINLIPATPSDVIDDDQFFDIDSEQSVAHASGSDGSVAAGNQESYEERMMESVEPEESKEESTMAVSKVVDGSAAEPEVSLDVEFGEEREVIPTKEEEKEKPKPRFIRGADQVAPLPWNPWKSESNIETYSDDIFSNVPPLPFTFQ